MLRIPPCKASGTYLDLNVPATGMNSPTQNSTTIKDATTLTKQPPGEFILLEERQKAGMAILILARR
jgi:hypothetical protein